MDAEKWLIDSVKWAEDKANKLRDRIAEQCVEQEEFDRLANLDEKERQPILQAAEKFLSDDVEKVNELADELALHASAPVDKPSGMTLEQFIHPPNVAPRLRMKKRDGKNILDYAYYFYWPIHFYETKLRLCLTISDQDEPLFITAKDLTTDSLYRIAATDLDLIKKRLIRNVERHAYLNKLYEAGVF